MKIHPTRVLKDADATLDYVFDFTNWLDGDTIASEVTTVSTGLTKDSTTNTTTSVTVWLSGGTVKESYTVTVRITTSAGRIDDAVLVVKVV